MRTARCLFVFVFVFVFTITITSTSQLVCFRAATANAAALLSHSELSTVVLW